MERLRHISLPQVYFKVMWIFAVLLYILIPLQAGVISIIYRGIVLITFACFFLLAVKRLDRSSFFVGSKEMACFILLVLTILISLSINNGAISLDVHIIGILGFIEMPIAIMLMDCVDYSEGNKRFILYTNVIIAFIFSILSTTKYAYSGILNSLYLGYSNPNATAIYLLLNQAILIMFLPIVEKRILKCTIIGLCIYEEYLIYLTNSRTCLMVSIILVIYYIAGKNIKIPKCFIALAMIFPLIFVLIYTNMYVSGKYNDLVILGKELFSGREEYFLSKMDILSWNNILGDVRQYYFTNMHNGPLTITASCGILGYTCWFLFYFWITSRYYNYAKSQLQYTSLVAILGVFIHSSSEAALIVGGAHYSIIVASFYWILRGSKNEL